MAKPKPIERTPQRAAVLMLAIRGDLLITDDQPAHVDFGKLDLRGQETYRELIEAGLIIAHYYTPKGFAAAREWRLVK
jgi:hypothetical protein